MITAAQCRAARALVKWTQADLASAADGVGVVTVRQFEAEHTSPRAVTLAAIQRALEAAGVIFIDQNGEGPGVRLRKSRTEPRFTILNCSDLGLSNLGRPTYFGVLRTTLEGRPAVILSNPPTLLSQPSITNSITPVVLKVIKDLPPDTDHPIFKALSLIGLHKRPSISDVRWFQFYPPEAIEFDNLRCQEVTFKNLGSPEWDDAPHEIRDLAMQAHANTEWPPLQIEA